MKQVESSNLVLFAVYDEETSYLVDLEKRTCTCKRFNHDEMPCSHAMAVIAKRNLNCYEFVSQYYTREFYIKTYEDSIIPLGDQHSWELPEDLVSHEVLPPCSKRPAGRPKKSRYKGFNEYKTKNVCGRCGVKGHNRRTCKNEQLMNEKGGKK